MCQFFIFLVNQDTFTKFNNRGDLCFVHILFTKSRRSAKIFCNCSFCDLFTNYSISGFVRFGYTCRLQSCNPVHFSKFYFVKPRKRKRIISLLKQLLLVPPQQKHLIIIRPKNHIINQLHLHDSSSGNQQLQNVPLRMTKFLLP